jgi:hypothetical protein
MESVNDIRNELKGLNSPLADMPRTMPYEVPQGYFESLEDGITLMRAGKEMPYVIPQGYFEGLATEILFEVNKPQQQHPFSVPGGYFDALPAELLAKAKQSDKKPKTISIGVTIWKNVRWAAAAVLLLGVGLGVYKNYLYQPKFNVQDELSTLSQDEIHEYVQQHIEEYDVEAISSGSESFEVKPAANQLSNEEIEKYLKETGL